MIDGTDLSRLDDDELALFRNRTIGFIFQFHFLLPQFTVLENVLIPAMIYDGFATPAMEKRALELLERVGLSHRRDSRANAISGGEQQRAAVAGLINQPASYWPMNLPAIWTAPIQNWCSVCCER